MSAEVRVTRRTKNIRFGWTSSVESSARGLVVRDPVTEERQLTPHQLHHQFARAQRINSGNAWRWAITIGGKRVRDPRLATYQLDLLVSGLSQAEWIEVV